MPFQCIDLEYVSSISGGGSETPQGRLPPSLLLSPSHLSAIQRRVGRALILHVLVQTATVAFDARLQVGLSLDPLGQLILQIRHARALLQQLVSK